MAVTVRPAERSDASTLLDLIDALAAFEELTPPDHAARERLTRHGWPEDGGSPKFKAWIAEAEPYEGSGAATPAGYAITFETYSTFLAKPTLYLEDLFVLPAFRRNSVGAAIMNRLLQEADDRGCGRMEWVVLDWNTDAQKFYHQFGAIHHSEWLHYRKLVGPAEQN